VELKMTKQVKFLVKDHLRLDKLVAAQLPELSRSQAKKLIESGNVTINNNKIKPSDIPPLNTEVLIILPILEDFDKLAKNANIPIIFEDENMVALNKPAGLLVHPSDSNLIEMTLLNIMRIKYPSIINIGNTNRSGVVHRLDRDTSGVMVYAKNEIAQATLKEQWKNRETLKIYLAVVKGCPEPQAGIIDAPIGKDPSNSGKQAVVDDGLSAESSYNIIERFSNKFSLLEVKIKTGRTHQIRVHLSAIGHPVLGDKLYGLPIDQISRQALHSKTLGVKIPSTGEWKEFTADTPQDMIVLIDYLRLNYKD
jgi:23S rRNA pseudouridine1911/1915/1917 synthase|tara:strand:- start:2455 stop:3381 length:927 start_codon:yes stop_codon:yes gene_type:complete